MFNWPKLGLFVSLWERGCAVGYFVDQWMGEAGVCVSQLSVIDACPSVSTVGVVNLMFF